MRVETNAPPARRKGATTELAPVPGQPNGTLTIEETPAGLPPGAGRPGDPCVMVIFGAAGDLTKRKLLPALYNLAADRLLASSFAVVGVARAEMSTEQFREKLSAEIREFATNTVEQALWDWFAQRIYYVAGDFHDAATYQRLQELLAQVDANHGTQGNYF